MGLLAAPEPVARQPTLARGLLPEDRRHFQRALLRWFGSHGRELPWRERPEPYRILVSEILLQQTQVERVIPKFLEFVARYPDFESLADAPVEEVVTHWYPLGYNRRPIRLHAIAAAVVKNGGTLPRDEASLMPFRGIGRYTAGAIRSFAFGEDAAVVDTNIRRVLGRVFGGQDPTRWPSVAQTYTLAASILPTGRSAAFNAALMDLGATLCLPRKPKCGLCLVSSWCLAAGQFRAIGPEGARRARRGAGSRRAAARALRGRAWRSTRRRGTP